MDETLQDLTNDFTELATLSSDAILRLEVYIQALEQAKEKYYPSSRQFLDVQAQALLATYTDVRGHIADELRRAGTWSVDDSARLIEEKKQYTDLLRVLQTSLSAVLSAGSWQSPSFAHTNMSQAGGETGTIGASMNDYKRDAHIDDRQYTKSFVHEYIDRGLRFSPHAFTTSSGMSAVTTVLANLAPQVGPNDVVLVGQSSYFQNKWALQQLFGSKVLYVDEFDTEKIIALVKKHQPPIIFLDSLCGAETLPMPHLQEIIPRVSKILSSRSTLVIDNTGLGMLYQPLHDLPLRVHGMRLVIVESLLKYHQFGFDRVNGGIVWAPAGSQQGLFESRMHLGTIMPDASVLALPTPNRALLSSRLMRIGRNTLILAQRIEELTKKEGSVVSHVVYPGLPTYPGFAWTKNLPFKGGFFVLAFKQQFADVSHYDAFVSRVLHIAKEKGVDIVGGTSFGFSITRVYVTARYATDITKPFVRISVGTETTSELDALTDVFRLAILQ